MFVSVNATSLFQFVNRTNEMNHLISHQSHQAVAATTRAATPAGPACSGLHRDGGLVVGLRHAAMWRYPTFQLFQSLFSPQPTVLDY